MVKKILNAFSYIVGIIFITITCLFNFLLFTLKMIPNNYLIKGTIVLGVITLILSFFLFGWFKNKCFRVLKYISLVIAIIFISFYSFGIYSLNKTINLFDNIEIMKEEVTNYYVLVLKESKYEEISDLDGKSMGYFIRTDKEILDKIKLDLHYECINDINILKEKLLNGEFNSIIISDIIKNKYEEEVGFNEKVRTIRTISIKSKIEDITKRVSIKNTPFNVLISGIDTYGNINTVSRNDVNIVATINPNTNKILLTNIPRDYYVKLHGKDGLRDKLTHASSYGFNTAITTIEDILDIDINYYVKVNFNTVIDLVDIIGGVEIESDRYLNKGPLCQIRKGKNTLDGKCALMYARERYAYEDGDRHRGRNQQQVITAIFKKLTSGTTILSKYNLILEKLDGKFATSLDTDEVFSLIKYELEDLPNYEIKSIQLDGSGAMGKTYSYPNQDLWIMIPDEKTIETAKIEINNLLK